MHSIRRRPRPACGSSDPIARGRDAARLASLGNGADWEPFGATVIATCRGRRAASGTVPVVDRSTHVTLGGLMAGAVVGWGLGWIHAMLYRAYKSSQAAAALHAEAKRGVRIRFRDVAVLGFLLAVAAAFVLGNHHTK